MKIFISGKITGEDPEECKQKFLSATLDLRALNVAVVNPYALCEEQKEKNWNRCMDITKIALLECDAIYMLPDWYLSIGAREELNQALQAGMMVINHNKQIHTNGENIKK